MKKFLALLTLPLILMGCAKFPDGSSVFSEGLWLVPALTALGAVIFGIKTFREWAKGGYGGYVTKPSGVTKWEEDDKRFPIYKASYFLYFAGLTLATIGIIIGINASA